MGRTVRRHVVVPTVDVLLLMGCVHVTQATLVNAARHVSLSLVVLHTITSTLGSEAYHCDTC